MTIVARSTVFLVVDTSVRGVAPCGVVRGHNVAVNAGRRVIAYKIGMRPEQIHKQSAEAAYDARYNQQTHLLSIREPVFKSKEIFQLHSLLVFGVQYTNKTLNFQIFFHFSGENDDNSQILLFHTAVFHLFALLVVLLALANGGLGQGDADYGCTVKAAGDGIVERVHVVG